MGNQLQLACWRGDVSKVCEWIDFRYPFTFYTKPGPFGAHAIHIAAFRGHLEIVRLLIVFYCYNIFQDYDEKFKENITDLLLRALDSSDGSRKQYVIAFKMIETLFRSQQYKMNLWDLGLNYLDHNIAHNYYEIVRKLRTGKMPLLYILRCVDQNGPNAPLPDMPSHMTPLRLAVIVGHLGLVKRLLSLGVKLNLSTTDPNGNTVLHLAAVIGKVDIVQCLLDARCSLSIVNNSDETPFSTAVGCGSLPVINAMIKSPHFNFTSAKGKHAFDVAVAQNHLHVLSTLMRLPDDVNSLFGCIVDNFPPLHLASIGGNASIASKLVDCGAKLNLLPMLKQMSALHYACETSSTEVIDILVTKGLSVDISCDGDTPGDRAVLNGHMNALSALIKSGYDINRKLTTDPFKGCNYLHYTITLQESDYIKNSYLYNPSVYQLQFLISAGCDIYATMEGLMPIHFAASFNVAEAISCLVANGCPVDIPSEHGFLPIHCATVFNAIQAIEVIHELGGNLNASLNNRTPLNLATIISNTSTCRKLLELGANPNPLITPGVSPMHNAAFYRPDLVDLLVEYGGDVNADSRPYEYTEWSFSENGLHSSSLVFKPIHVAVLFNNAQALERLLQHRAEVNVPCLLATPLHMASTFGLVDMLQVLLRYEADKDKPGPNCFTPLHMATLYGHTEVVRILLSHNCNTELVTMEKSNHGRLTALHLASFARCPEIVKLLLQHSQIMINSLTADGLSALHLSLHSLDLAKKFLVPGSEHVVAMLSKVRLTSHSSQQSAVVSLLLDHGCDVNTVSMSGYTAYDFAKMYGFDHILPILHEAGGKDRVTLAIQDQEKKHNMEVQFLKDQLEAINQWKGTTEQSILDLQSELTHHRTMWDEMRSTVDAMKQQGSQSMSAPFYGGMFKIHTRALIT